MADFALVTDRLLLRDWRDTDQQPFAEICADPVVMTYLGPPQTSEEVAAAIARLRACQTDHGHCFWAAERRADGRMIGFCGLKPGASGTPIEGGIEIGWRFAADCWGHGYAREAAQASLDWGWSNLPDIDAIHAITVHANQRSRALMERLGMVRETALDFDHPALPEESPLRPHITYSIGRPR